MNIIYSILAYIVVAAFGQLYAYIEDKRYLIDKDCIGEVAVIGGFSIACLVWLISPSVTPSELIIISAIMGAFSVSAIVDAKTMEFPDSCTVLLGLLMVVYGLTSLIHPLDLWKHLLTLVVYIALGLFIDHKYPGYIGRGDFKLLAPIVFALSVMDTLWMVMIASVLSLILGIIKVYILSKNGTDANYRNTGIAFGPSLYVGFVLVLLGVI